MKTNLKRIITAILMMALLLGPLVSVPVNAEENEDNTFVVGFDAEFPPYGYKNEDGEYVGFDLDLAQEVCDRNGWTLKKQPIEWNSKDMELNSGSISCIWNGFTMNGREDDYTWTKPYVDNSQVVVVRKDSGITQLTDLADKVVAVQADSSALAALTGEDASEENKTLCASFKDLQQVGDYNSAFMNLESGAVDAICMDIGVANYEIESRGDKFMMLEDRLSSEEYGRGFKKGNTELRDKVQATLLDMLADGTFEEIAKKWGLEESICLTADDEVQEETTADDNTFIVGFDAEFPPYGYKNDDGEYVGFDLDLAQEVCDRNGWILKKQPIEWNSKDMELNSGSISCIWNGFTMNGREDDYTWTKPYVDNSQVVVVRKDSGITQLNDLSGKVVAVQADSSALAALTGEDASEENKALAETFKELQQVGDYNSAFMNLESGAVNAICMDIGVANYEIESRGDKFMMLEDRLSSEEYGIGFKKGNTELRDKVQATLLDMLADGTFDEIAEKWGLEESICLTADDEVQEETTADDNTFVVGFDAEFPPYGYKNDDGEYVGFDLDLAQEVCDRNGWILKKQPIEWNSKDMELNSGSISCIWNGFTMNGREDDYTWTKPYVDNSQVVVVRKDSGITQLNDLSGKVVAVQADSSALAALTGEDASEENKALAETFKELQQVGDYNSAFMNLESGAVNAICMDIGVANYEIESRGDKFMMLEDRLSSEEYGIGFKKGNTELRDKVQATLLDMLADGTFEEIAEKWGLEDSICLSPDDQVQDGNAAAATATDTTSTGKKNTSFWDKFCSITKQLAEGLLASLVIFFLTLLFSLPLGLLVAAGRMCKIAPIRWLVKFYISIARGTPLMLQLLVVFYGPYYLFGATLTTSYRFQAVIIGFALNYAAYFAEIYRSGIQAVPQGQHEAAKILGYSKSQTFFKIVFPQMAKNILPSVTNEVITLVKDTSLAFAISYTEMFTLAKQVAAAQTTIMPLFIAGVFYYIFNFVVAFVMEKIEKRMNYYK